MPARIIRLFGYAGRAAILFLTLPLISPAAELPRVSPDEPRSRRPVAIQRLNETTAIVANRSGTLSVIDLAKWSVVAEFDIGGQPSDLGVAGGRIVVTDAGRSRLIVVDVNRDSARVLSETPLPTLPVTVRISDDGSWCTVASLWARRLSFVSLPGDATSQPEIVATVALPFAPREQLQINSRKRLIVADAFGGRLAILDTAAHTIEAVHEFGGHNIRGLAVAPDEGRLLISHQILNDRAIPRRSDIIWGVMVDNMIRDSRLEKVLSNNPKAMQGARFISVGYAGQGAGDPDSLFVDGEGRMIIALAGVGEVSIVEADGNGFRRVAVGRRPSALMPVSDGRFVVANELSHSLSLVDTTVSPEEYKKSRSQKSSSANGSTPGRYESGSYGSTYLDSGIAVTHLKLGATPEPGPAERGERLFFDARLSHANWFSCHSCHTDGHSNGGLADTFGDDSTGAPKRVLSLLGVGETGPWGWNGKKASLLTQVHQSAASTMKGRGISRAAAEDIVAFLKTLRPPPPFQAAHSAEEKQVVIRGRALFETLSCTECHSGHTLTSPEIQDVGLVDERGLRKFSPPSLRGVAHRYRLLHDGQAADVEEVVGRLKHQLPRPLTRAEQQALIRYLKSL